jgi:hypothetical protein
MPSASPAVIEVLRNFLRVIVFVALLMIDYYVEILPRQWKFSPPKGRISERGRLLDIPLTPHFSAHRYPQINALEAADEARRWFCGARSNLLVRACFRPGAFGPQRGERCREKQPVPLNFSLGEKIGGKIGLEDGSQKINRCPTTL